jgi:radical SAM/Cys-rich protein
MTPPRPEHIWQSRSEFSSRVESVNRACLRAETITSVMLNVGMVCDLSCELCHHSCSPLRTESMSREVMYDAVRFAAEARAGLLDITGGEPTLWPHLTECLQLARSYGLRTRVRTNGVALLLTDTEGVAQAIADSGAEVLASMPENIETGGRRLSEAIAALKLLASLGYGDSDVDQLALDLAYNPLPGHLPRAQQDLENELRLALRPHRVRFRSLLAITTVEAGRFEEWLNDNRETEDYRKKLHSQFNPDVLPALACRHGITIDWNGNLWDCDFNLAACTPLTEEPRSVSTYVGSPVGQAALSTRSIAYAEHCYACTAGAGSS